MTPPNALSLAPAGPAAMPIAWCTAEVRYRGSCPQRAGLGSPEAGASREPCRSRRCLPVSCKSQWRGAGAGGCCGGGGAASTDGLSGVGPSNPALAHRAQSTQKAATSRQHDANPSQRPHRSVQQQATRHESSWEANNRDPWRTRACAAAIKEGRGKHSGATRSKDAACRTRGTEAATAGKRVALCTLKLPNTALKRLLYSGWATAHIPLTHPHRITQPPRLFLLQEFLFIFAAAASPLGSRLSGSSASATKTSDSSAAEARPRAATCPRSVCHSARFSWAVCGAPGRYPGGQPSSPSADPAACAAADERSCAAAA